MQIYLLWLCSSCLYVRICWSSLSWHGSVATVLVMTLTATYIKPFSRNPARRSFSTKQHAVRTLSLLVVLLLVTLFILVKLLLLSVAMQDFIHWKTWSSYPQVKRWGRKQPDRHSQDRLQLFVSHLHLKQNGHAFRSNSGAWKVCTWRMTDEGCVCVKGGGSACVCVFDLFTSLATEREVIAKQACVVAGWKRERLISSVWGSRMKRRNGETERR